MSGSLPSDFGFPIQVHALEPDTVYVVPITSDAHHFPPDGKLRVYSSRTGGTEWEALTDGLPQRHCYVNVPCHDSRRAAVAAARARQCGRRNHSAAGQEPLLIVAMAGG